MREKTRLSERTVSQVLDLLSRLDPYGLEPGSDDGPPANEYESEARDIAQVLQRSRSVSVAQIDAIWQYWFEEPLSGIIGEDRLEHLLRDLTALPLQADAPPELGTP